MTKYRVHPGHVYNDDTNLFTFLSANALMELYKVPRHECYVCTDGYIPRDDKLINLYPDPSGRYTIGQA